MCDGLKAKIAPPISAPMMSRVKCRTRQNAPIADTGKDMSRSRFSSPTREAKCVSKNAPKILTTKILGYEKK
jgi:hypothetical protein